MKVIILGASGHVGKNVSYWLTMMGHECYNCGRKPGYLDINTFSSIKCADLLINCIGVGSPQKEEEIGPSLLELEKYWDNECIKYIKDNPYCRYFYFSSGIADDRYVNPSEYCQTKRYIENKHKRLGLSITDFRLFSFFSRFIDIENNQLLPSIIRAIKTGATLEVSPTDIQRDYIHPSDIANIIENSGNTTESGKYERIVLASGGPTDKDEILHTFHEKYGLKFRYNTDIQDKHPSYIPRHKNARALRSMETLILETDKILRGN